MSMWDDEYTELHNFILNDLKPPEDDLYNKVFRVGNWAFAIAMLGWIASVFLSPAFSLLGWSAFAVQVITLAWGLILIRKMRVWWENGGADLAIQNKKDELGIPW